MLRIVKMRFHVHGYLLLPIVLMTFFVILVVISSPARGSNLIQMVANGRIDWTNRIIEATGKGLYPKVVKDEAQARSIAKQRAVRAARNNLLSIIKNLPLDSHSTVSDYLKAHPDKLLSLMSFIRRADQAEICFGGKGLVRVTLSLKFNGMLADLLLPDYIKIIEPIKQGSPCRRKTKRQATAVVIDCSGIDFKPSLIPRIVNERNNEVFGPVFVSRECVVKEGMVKYVVPPDNRIKELWAGSNPIVLKALRVAQGKPTVVVLTNADADRIKDEPSNLDLFHYCRVVFLVRQGDKDH